MKEFDMRLVLVPNTSLGRIRFGMAQSQVRKLMTLATEPFDYTNEPFDRGYAYVDVLDDLVEVRYSVGRQVIAVAVDYLAAVELDGELLPRSSFAALTAFLRERDPDLKITSRKMVSRKLGIEVELEVKGQENDPRSQVLELIVFDAKTREEATPRPKVKPTFDEKGLYRLPLVVYPNQGVEGIRFGMSRSEVHSAVEEISARKTSVQVFDRLHMGVMRHYDVALEIGLRVEYSDDDRCQIVAIFEPAQAVIFGQDSLGRNLKEVLAHWSENGAEFSTKVYGNILDLTNGLFSERNDWTEWGTLKGVAVVAPWCVRNFEFEERSE
jgi:hypothetical protein